MRPTVIIPKSELKVGAYYSGVCRNARTARWDGEKFHHWRTKWGAKFIETIKHREDDDVFDVFDPVEVVTWGCEAIPIKELGDDEDSQ